RTLALKIFHYLFDYREPFIDRVLNERHSGHVADEINSLDVGLESLIAFRNLSFWNLLLCVDYHTGLGIGGTLHLAACILHTLVAGYRSRDSIDDCKHVVRAGFDAGVTTDAGLLIYDRMRVRGFFGLQFLEIQNAGERFCYLRLVWRCFDFDVSQKALS